MIKNNKGTKMELIIPLDSYRQMMSYVQLAKGEITWFFDVVFDPDLTAFTVGKVYLLPQEATGGSVEMSEEDVTKFMLQLVDEGVEQLPRGWGHSHVDMSAFFSGTDENTIEQLDTGSFLVALVTNKRQEYEATVKFNYPDFDYRVDLDIVVDNMVMEIPEEYKLEVEQKVKHKEPKVLYYNYGGKKYPPMLNSGKKGKGKHGYTRDPDNYTENYASDSLDPVIQEQFNRGGTGAERGSMRIHEVPLSDDVQQTDPQEERICTKCWLFEGDHKSDPNSCSNPNYLDFEKAMEKNWDGDHA